MYKAGGQNGDDVDDRVFRIQSSGMGFGVRRVQSMYPMGVGAE